MGVFLGRKRSNYSQDLGTRMRREIGRLSDMRLHPGLKVERHIYFNSNFDELVREDPEDKGYADYSYYFQRNKLGEKVTEENAEQFAPFLELLILSDPLGYCSFMVSFLSEDELDKNRWQRIQLVVQKYLEEFELEKAGPKRKGLLFFPRDKEKPESPGQVQKAVDRLCNAYKVKLLYKEALRDLRDMLKAGASTHQIASAFGMSADYVQEVLTGRKSHRPAPAELAKEWLLIKQLRLLEGYCQIDCVNSLLLQKLPNGQVLSDLSQRV
jgi:hypothetical protein